MAKQRVGSRKVIEDPEQFIELLSKHARSERRKLLIQSIIDGPHLEPEELFQFATDPSYEISENHLKHIVICPLCMDQFIMLQEAHEELWGNTFGEVKPKRFNTKEFLINLVSASRIQISSWVKRLVPEPEPVFSLGFQTGQTARDTGTPRKIKTVEKSIETTDFEIGEDINVDIQIPNKGYVTALIISQSGSMMLVHPGEDQGSAVVSTEQSRKISFKTPETPGLWTFKAILTADDPLRSLKRPIDERTHTKALRLLAKYVEKLEKDTDFWIGTLEFKVKRKI